MAPTCFLITLEIPVGGVQMFLVADHCSAVLTLSVFEHREVPHLGQETAADVQPTCQSNQARMPPRSPPTVASVPSRRSRSQPVQRHPRSPPRLPRPHHHSRPHSPARIADNETEVESGTDTASSSLLESSGNAPSSRSYFSCVRCFFRCLALSAGSPAPSAKAFS